MGPYDNRSVTLDPGLTALALRALHERDGSYPFVDRFRRRRTRRRARPESRRILPVHTAPAAPFWPRSLRPAELFPTFSRLRRLGGSQSAAA